ncbi:MAG: plasmid mobilization relaxosome protein MobC [Hyphomicrobiales bacterium]|jgi:hypothetical protein|nr:plasmid mobilization relaxosome protein MobC [Hyphomicrobiales bacterium]
MARPRKQPHERRSEVVRFTVRPAEHALIAQRAAASGNTVSGYARHLVLNGRIVIRQGRGLDHAAFDQLRRIGVNLNQLVKLYHSTGSAPPELASTVAAVERFLMETIDGSGS